MNNTLFTTNDTITINTTNSFNLGKPFPTSNGEMAETRYTKPQLISAINNIYNIAKLFTIDPFYPTNTTLSIDDDFINRNSRRHDIPVDEYFNLLSNIADEIANFHKSANKDGFAKFNSDDKTPFDF